jgi:excisionase family DNA binding protein
MANFVPREIADSIALSVEEVCELIGIGRTTFYKLLNGGKLTAYKCGNRTIVLWDELEQELKSFPRAGSVS